MERKVKGMFLRVPKSTSQIYKFYNLQLVMNIGEALSLLKKEKSRLSRMITLRKDNVFVEMGKKSEFNPLELSEKINTKIEDIRSIKIRIQNTNLSAKLIGDNISLAEAIIKVNDLRSKIGDLSKLFEKKRDPWYIDRDKKEMTSQIDESIIEDEIEILENEKSKLDNMIQMTNWKTNLSD